MNNELEKIKKEAVEVCFKLLPRNFLGGTEETREKSGQPASGLGSNPAHREYEAVHRDVRSSRQVGR